MPGNLIRQIHSISPTGAVPKIFSKVSQERPSPLNVATHAVVKIWHEQIGHPYHARVKRRLAEFDRSKLHLLVITQNAGVRHATVRMRSIRRIRSLLFDALKERGYNWDGTPRTTSASSPNDVQRVSLSGAHRLVIHDVPLVLNTSVEEIRKQCGQFVTSLIESAQRRQDMGKKDMRAGVCQVSQATPSWTGRAFPGKRR